MKDAGYEMFHTHKGRKEPGALCQPGRKATKPDVNHLGHVTGQNMQSSAIEDKRAHCATRKSPPQSHNTVLIFAYRK